jgi:catechol 2,3-dioxygenase-like lactoylglutathione lyase family enzyme
MRPNSPSIKPILATIGLTALLISGGHMSHANAESKQTSQSTGTAGDAPMIAAVRYQIRDLDRAIAFYTGPLEFKLEHRAGSAFAMVSRAPLQLVLSGPGSSGARPMPDGRRQEPGGWNRIILYVRDLDAQIQRLKAAGVPFRNSVEVGPGGSQIQIEDPDGNPLELHEGGAGGGK